MRPLGRVVTVGLGQAGASGALLAGFRIAFDVAYTGSSPGKATIKVWNAPEALVFAAFAGPLPTVILTAGHLEATTGAPLPALPLFVGDVEEFAVRRSGVDTITEIRATSAGRAWQRAVFRFTTPSPSAYSALVPLAVAQAGLVLRSLVPARDVPLPLGAYVDESFRDFMGRAAAALGCSWRVDGTFVDVWPSVLPNPASIGVVFDTSNTIGAPSVKKGAISLRGLLNGKVRPGTPIVVVNPIGPGTYHAKDVKFTGDSGYDAAFWVDIDAELPGS